MKGKTKLRFVESHADGQDSFLLAKKKKKTVNAKLYSQEMLKFMLDDIKAVDPNFFFVRDGAKSHTAAFPRNGYRTILGKRIGSNLKTGQRKMNPCDFFSCDKTLHELAKRRFQVK